jgi:hypothetical protein
MILCRGSLKKIVVSQICIVVPRKMYPQDPQLFVKKSEQFSGTSTTVQYGNMTWMGG